MLEKLYLTACFTSPLSTSHGLKTIIADLAIYNPNFIFSYIYTEREIYIYRDIYIYTEREIYIYTPLACQPCNATYHTASELNNE